MFVNTIVSHIQQIEIPLRELSPFIFLHAAACGAYKWFN